MASRLQGWLALPWRDRLRLPLLSFGLMCMHASLALLGYRRTHDWVSALTERRVRRTAREEERLALRRLAELAAIAGRHGLVEARCLRQSLLLFGWLRLKGLSPVIEFGIPGNAEEFAAHAWVSLDGQPLRPDDAGHRPFRPVKPA